LGIEKINAGKSMKNNKKRSTIRILVTLIILVLGVRIYNQHCASNLIEALRVSNSDAIDKYMSMPWDVNTKVKGPWGESRGYGTALGSACFYGNYEAAKKLIERGANVNLYSEYGLHPFAAVFATGYFHDYETVMDICDYLLENGAVVEDLSGIYSPLGRLGGNIDAYSKKMGEESVVNLIKYLFSAGAKYEGSNLLYFAAYDNQVEVIKYLLEEANIEFDYETLDRESLTGAAEGSSYEAAEYLVSVGFRRDIKNSKGKTALDIAKEKNDIEMIEILTKQ